MGQTIERTSVFGGVADRSLVALPCELSMGSFSGERFFDVTLANGETYHGFAPRFFCWNASGKLVEGSEPETQSPGMVAAKVIQWLDDQVQVEVPDGQVIAVDRNMVKSRPTPILPPGSFQA
jgi:hypothetical protein